MDQLRVKRFNPNAILPVRAHPTDAGLDLFSPIDIDVQVWSFVKIDIGIGIALPEGKVGLILGRSSMGSQGIGHLAGVIDANYRGSIGVIVTNAVGDVDYEIKAGDKIAQLLIVDAYTPAVVEVDEFETTDRNTNGFGSTGR
jgi:dUTP pyrophosphatase